MKNLSKYLTLAVLPATIALISSCTTLNQLDNLTQEVTIRSNPAGAAVTIDGAASGVTPVVAAMKRNQTYRVTIAQPGYQYVVVSVAPMVVPVYNHNGPMTTRQGNAPLTPNPVSVKLTPVKNPVTALSTAVSKLDAQLKSKEITPAQHKQYVADLVKFYSQAP